MDVNEILWECLRHFANLDESNAAIHMAEVRYSPITFRLAEALMNAYAFDQGPKDALVRLVYSHKGRYEEDSGR